MPDSIPDDDSSVYFRSKEVSTRIVASRYQHPALNVSTPSFAVAHPKTAGEIDLLPATAKELIDVISLHEAIALFRECGGGDLNIPEVINGTARMWFYLVEIVGQQAAEKLVYRYAGTQIYVPTCHLFLLSYRDRQIISRFDAGEPFDLLRREYKLTRRHLYRVLKKPL